MNRPSYTTEEDIQQYWEKGGTYILPVEIVNNMLNELEELDEEVKEANNNAAWWKNRYEAQVEINKELKHDRYNKKVSRNNKYFE